MYLRDCELGNLGGFVGSQLQRNRPEDRWVDAGYSGAIPLELYTLYLTVWISLLWRWIKVFD